MTRFADLVRRYGFDILVVFLAIAAAAEIVIRRESEGAPTSSPWLTVPAIVVMALTLLARERYPFAGPAAYWLLAAGLSFVDGRVVTFPTGVFVLGMAASFLLGNLSSAREARTGLAIVLAGTLIVIFNRPDHAVGEFVFIPLLFGICWLLQALGRLRRVKV